MALSNPPSFGSKRREIKIGTHKLKTTVVFDSYWRFAAERQEIFFKRLRNNPPYTDNPILQTHRFTNAYRASDRVSQYLIQNVLFHGDQTPTELFFRCLLFKIFNRIETWELLIHELGSLTWLEYDFGRYSKILEHAMRKGQPIYSAAYIMASGKSTFGFARKHQNHLRLIELMIKDNVPYRLNQMSRMADAFTLLKAYPTIGDFLAYQYVTDLNYSSLTSFSENEFTVAGPGAVDGIHKCFGDTGKLSPDTLIHFMFERQENEFERLNIKFRTLWGRPLQLIDCQNLFCEVDKYARVAHPKITGKSNRKQIKQKYRYNSRMLKVWYPPAWRVNKHIPSKFRAK